jgi:peptidyl-dipeptidase Dcp
MRQLSFGLLDMGWHGQDPTAITDVKALKPNNLQPQTIPEVAENVMSTAFSHIFKVVIHQDITVTNGPKFWMLMHLNISRERNFHKEVATKFKENILSKGGTEHPMTLYKRFRGQEPKPDALLKREGLL